MPLVLTDPQEQAYFARVLSYYQGKLSEAFLHTPMTTYALSAARAMLENLVREKQRSETHRLWFVPLQLYWDASTYSFVIEAAP